MDNREHKPPPGTQQAPQRSHQRIDLGHVKQRHGAQSRVELPLTQRQQRLLVRCVQHFETQPALVSRRASARMRDHLLRKVGGHHLGPHRGHAPRREPVPAGNIQYALAWLQRQHPLRWGPREHLHEIVAFPHPLVPERGVLIPRSAGLLVGLCQVIPTHYARPPLA